MKIFIPSRLGIPDGTKTPSCRVALIFHIITENVYMNETRRDEMGRYETRRVVSAEPRRYMPPSRHNSPHINVFYLFIRDISPVEVISC